MTTERETVELTVRSMDIVDASGAIHHHLRVFCPAENRSLDPQICARCDLCESAPEEWGTAGGRLRCNVRRHSDPPPAAAWFVGRDPVSTWTPAGAVGGRVLVCAREEAPIPAVRDALARHGLGSALVVDDRTRVLGVVSRALLSPARNTPVLAVVDADVDIIDEGAPLAEVIARMAYRRAHWVALVTDEGRAAGLVSEITLLQWVAHRGASW